MTTQRTFTDEEEKREATGKMLGMVGTVVGLAGTVMALSVNPAVKSAGASVARRVPATVVKNKMLLGIAGAGLLAALIAVWYTKKLKGK